MYKKLFFIFIIAFYMTQTMFNALAMDDSYIESTNNIVTICPSPEVTMEELEYEHGGTLTTSSLPYDLTYIQVTWGDSSYNSINYTTNYSELEPEIKKYLAKSLIEKYPETFKAVQVVKTEPTFKVTEYNQFMKYHSEILQHPKIDRICYTVVVAPRGSWKKMNEIDVQNLLLLKEQQEKIKNSPSEQKKMKNRRFWGCFDDYFCWPNCCNGECCCNPCTCPY